MTLSLGGGALGTGLMLGSASILSMGPSNVMLVREGLVGGRIALVAGAVWLSNLLLLSASLILSGTIIAGLSPFRTALAWLGLVAVAWCAVTSFRAARSSVAFRGPVTLRRESARDCLSRVLRVVWLNPLFYIELLLIPASVCEGLSGSAPRLQFLAGLLIMVTIKVSGYAFGAGSCAPLLKHRRSIQIFDFASGAMLSAVGLFMTARLIGRL